MPGIGGSTLRGGQTVFHGIRMWGQLFRAAMFLSAFTTVAVPAWTLWQRTTGAEWYAAGMVTLAEVKLVLGYDPESGDEIEFLDGTSRVMSIRDIAVSVPARKARDRIRDEMFASAWLGALAGGGLIALFLAAFWVRGAQLGRQKRIRGAEMVTAGELRRRVRPAHLRARDRMPGWKALGPYSIAGIPYPERTETQHTIVSGTTGSGKTVLISDLVSQIRARGERCVVYDKMGSYTAAFFDRDRDALLNPLDARSPRWSPFYEARSPRDFDMMAAALIPQQKDTVDPFWVTAARQLFANGAGVLRQKGETRNRVLVDRLLKTELTELAQAMEGTVAQSIVDPENPKTALSVRAMLTANLSALEFLPDTGKPFSIREWISDEASERNGGGFLFLTSRGDQHASLRGLISTWLEIAVNAMLSLDQDDGRRIWVILDELPTLHQVPSLQPGLAESRQFGGCFVLGVQVASALRDLYGRNGAETISGLCGTRVVLAAPDRDTAQWSADSLGRSEIEEVTEGYSYGANTIRDGVSLTPRRELRALALPSEIMRLENLAGYLKFPGPFPVATIRLRYVKRPAAAERFVPREGDAAEPVEGSGVAANARDAGVDADDGMTIPAAAEANLPGGGALPGRDGGPDPARRQGELDLPPLPGEAGSAEAEGRPASPAPEDSSPDGKSVDDAPPDGVSEQKSPPGEALSTEDEDAAGPGAGRASDWG
jgi:type IV conjugative transfer system coupling protein TraD